MKDHDFEENMTALYQEIYNNLLDEMQDKILISEGPEEFSPEAIL